MEEIYKQSLLMVHAVTKLCGLCNLFNADPNEENGEKIVEAVDNCEDKLLKVKEQIVKMIRDADDRKNTTQVTGKATEAGFLLNKER